MQPCGEEKVLGLKQDSLRARSFAWELSTRTSMEQSHAQLARQWIEGHEGQKNALRCPMVHCCPPEQQLMVADRIAVNDLEAAGMRMSNHHQWS